MLLLLLLPLRYRHSLRGWLLVARTLALSLFSGACLSVVVVVVESARRPSAPATGEQCCARETPPQILSDVDDAGSGQKKKYPSPALPIVSCVV
jgi:hypothetical protein